MNLTVTSENKVYTIAITGRIDTLTAPELESKFREIEKTIFLNIKDFMKHQRE